MRSKSLFLYAIGLCAATATIPVSAQVYSLDSCRNMAIGNNKSIKIADEAVKSTGYERKAAKAAYLPGIDFEAAYLYNQHKMSLLSEDAMLPTMSFDPTTGSYNYNILTDASGMPVTNPSTGSYIPTEVAVIPKDALTFDTRSIFGGAVTLTQPVYMGGQIKALNDIAKYTEGAAVAARNQAVQNLIYEVDEAYWQVVSLKAKRELAESFVNLVDTLHYNVEAMLEEGVATRSDLLTVDVKLNEAKIMLTKVDNGLTLSRMALAQICGMPIDADMHLEDEESAGKSVNTAAAYTYDMNDVYANRQDLNAVRQGISLLESRERLTLGNMLPKIGVFGAYAFSTPNLQDGFSKSIKGGFHVGAAVTIPIWHWGGDYNHYKAAKTATNAQRLLLEDLEEKVSLQVSQAQFKYQEAFKTYYMSLANMKSAEENLRNAQYGYSEGLLTTNDVIMAQTGWLQANSEKIDACIGVRLCEVYLDKVLGTIKY